MNDNKFDRDVLESIIRNNLSCYYDKPLNNELIKVITQQIVDSIDYILSKTRDNN